MKRSDGNRKKRWGNAAHLSFFVSLSSSLFRHSLNSQQSVKKTRPASENHQPLGLRRFCGKQISSQPSFGSANSQAEIISSRIAQVPGTNNGQKATVVSMTQIRPIGVIMSRQNSYRSRTHFTAHLPYNDKAHTGHRPEAPRVVPWFQEAYQGPAVSTCKDRWVAIRKDNRIAFAQWEDAGPFRTDHWQYVFGNERPKPNLNQGAGLDVSPAVRDYLGLKQTDVTDWRFVDLSDVPRGPWATLGDNNNFVINSRKKDVKVTERLKQHEAGVFTQ